MGNAPACSRLAVIVSFLNEREYLPTLLASLAEQTRLPDQLLLVDDGSTDGSAELAEQFAAAHPYAHALRRPPRPPEADRLASAAELQAFQWGSAQVDPNCQLIAKLDADLELNPNHFAEVCALLERDPRIGVAGAHLSIRAPSGQVLRERYALGDHVRGPNKFYRRACLEQIGPLPAHLGWDTLDEVKARMCGWRVVSIPLTGSDTIHLRPTGAFNGRVRACWRWGECAHGYGSHPITVLAGGLARFRRRPYIVSGLAFVGGWVSASIRSCPQPEPEVRHFRHREEFTRLRSVYRGAAHAAARKLPRRASVYQS
jgi:glycosyltransferase involved in cell wall biosynthesis